MRILLIDCGQASRATRGVGVVFNEFGPAPFNKWDLPH